MGAATETAKAFREVFYFPPDTVPFKSAYTELYNRLASEEHARFSLVNAVFLQEDYDILRPYENELRSDARSELYRVDFKNDSARTAARGQANQWVMKHTNDLIEELVTEDMLNKYTRMLITNAVYFEAKWADAFFTAVTREGDFTLGSGKTAKAEFMRQSAQVRYVDADSLQFFELPYRQSEYSMYFLKPAELMKPAKFLETFSPEMIDKLIRKSKYGKAAVVMPKFKITLRSQLKAVLVDMGLKEAFSRKADFSKISGEKDLRLDKVVHEAYVKVNEDGTIAAAATAATMLRKTSMEKPPEVKLELNQPFFFFIYHKPTRTILFTGVYVKPPKQ